MMMTVKIEIEIFDHMPCSCKLKINNVQCHYTDFVDSYDAEPTDESYTCGNRVARPVKITLVKKNLEYIPELKDLTIEDIEEIQDKLCDALRVGYCNYCW